MRLQHWIMSKNSLMQHKGYVAVSIAAFCFIVGTYFGIDAVFIALAAYTVYVCSYTVSIRFQWYIALHGFATILLLTMLRHPAAVTVLQATLGVVVLAGISQMRRQ
jgi:hypothetical protein